MEGAVDAGSRNGHLLICPYSMKLQALIDVVKGIEEKAILKDQQEYRKSQQLISPVLQRSNDEASRELPRAVVINDGKLELVRNTQENVERPRQNRQDHLKTCASCSGLQSPCDCSNGFNAIKTSLKNSTFYDTEVRGRPKYLNKLMTRLERNTTLNSTQRKALEIFFERWPMKSQTWFSFRCVTEGFSAAGLKWKGDFLEVDQEQVFRRMSNFHTFHSTNQAELRRACQPLIAFVRENMYLDDATIAKRAPSALTEEDKGLKQRPQMADRPIHQQRAIILTSENSARAIELRKVERERAELAVLSAR